MEYISEWNKNTGIQAIEQKETKYLIVFEIDVKSRSREFRPFNRVNLKRWSEGKKETFGVLF